MEKKKTTIFFKKNKNETKIETWKKRERERGEEEAILITSVLCANFFDQFFLPVKLQSFDIQLIINDICHVRLPTQ